MFGFIEAEKAHHPVALLCRVLGVSRSGYYAWRERPPSARTQSNLVLTERIRTIHERSRGTYGAPRIHAELRYEGVCCSRKRVARLLRYAGLQGCHRRKGPRTTRRSPEMAPAPDLVKRDFAASAPDRLWVADITYVPTWAGFLYLAVVLDACSRRDRRLGDGRAFTHGVGDRSGRNGALAATTRWSHPPLGPGEPVHEPRLRAGDYAKQG